MKIIILMLLSFSVFAAPSDYKCENPYREHKIVAVGGCNGSICSVKVEMMDKNNKKVIRKADVSYTDAYVGDSVKEFREECGDKNYMEYLQRSRAAGNIPMNPIEWELRFQRMQEKYKRKQK